MLKVYGIPNCNTVKKAINWLNQHQIAFEFIDFKKKGVDEVQLHQWATQTGWQIILNKKGTTWRTLDAGTQDSIIDLESSIKLMIAKPSVIKRPIIEKEGRIVVGFDEQTYQVFL